MVLAVDTQRHVRDDGLDQRLPAIGRRRAAHQKRRRCAAGIGQRRPVRLLSEDPRVHPPAVEATGVVWRVRSISCGRDADDVGRSDGGLQQVQVER